jgi:hypothetical protein
MARKYFSPKAETFDDGKLFHRTPSDKCRVIPPPITATPDNNSLTYRGELFFKPSQVNSFEGFITDA